MPTIVNMCKKLISKLAYIPFIVLVYDLGTAKMWQLNHQFEQPSRDKTFTIVLDQEGRSNSLLYPDTYFCSSINELENIINFVHENYMLFSDNILDNEYDPLLSEDCTIELVSYNDDRILE